jgi:RHS repeat-associated protein
VNGGVAVTAGGSISNAATFTVIYPKVAGISPSSGAVGTQVTISGSNFGSTQGFVNFQGARGTIVSWSDTAITATVPAGAQSGGVSLNAGGVNSNGAINFTVYGPIVTSISPTSGIVGTQVTINGSGFVALRGSSSVTFNTFPASVVTWSDTQVVATVPAGAKTGSAEINVNGTTPSNLDVVFSMPNPIITSLSPAVGPMDTVVQVNGSGFGATQGSGTLTFSSAFGGPGTVTATPLTWSDTAITAKVPSNASSGALIVTVGGVASPSTISFTVPRPQITGVSPARGITGTQITVTGSGFHATQGSGSLNYSDGVPSSSIVSWSDTQIVANVQSNGSSGGLYVTQNLSSNTDVMFTFISPVITSLSPTAGPVGTQVQINGSGFGATQGTSAVNFVGAAGSIISWSDTQIVATAPAATRSGQVTVSVGGVASNSNINYTVPSPQIASITPTSGIVGTTVTIAGSGFQSSTGGHLFFNGTVATVTNWNDAQIVTQVPAGATSGGISVTADNGAASNQDVLFTLPNPTVTAVAPASGPGGTQVTVSGTGFGASRGSSTIAFGGASASSIVSWSDTQIVALVPSTAGSSSPVQVTEGGVAGNTNVYFTVTSPTITSLSPTVGGGGNPVTITGTGFEATQGPSSQVIISGGGAAIRSWSDTQIVAIVPPSATTGSARVYVNNSPSNYVTYTVPANTITGLSPTTGPVGTPVTVHGSGFGASQGTSVLSFNGQPAASITSWTDTQIVGTVPETAASGPAIVAVNNINSNATNLFTVPPPFITSLSPQGGIAGTSVTINGIAFQSTQRDSIIKFNGIPATVTSWSDSQIVATVPSGAATGPVQVTVNSVSTSGNSFEVPNPVIASISRPEAPAGGTVTITGSGFGPGDRISPDGISILYVGWVEVNGIAGGVISWSDTSITAQLPLNATTGSLTVVKYDTTSNGVPITIEGAPSVASLSPAVGPINASIVISGSGFGATQYDSTVQFSGISATITAWSDTQITATVPPGEYTGPVNVTVAQVTGPTQNFTLSTSSQITDALGNSSSYTSVMLAGSWLSADSTGSGCSSCTTRGTIHNDYDIYGNPTAETDELLHVTNYTYDASQNLTSATAHLDPSTPVITSYTYNSFGEPLTVTDPLGNVTTNTYDANGNLLTVTPPVPVTGTAASITQFAYDTKGQLTTITDPLNHITTMTYYPTGLIHTITDPQSNVTSYEYDLRGNRTAVVDALLNRTAFAYDAGNRLTGITYADSTTVSFTYDARGRRISVTDQNGKVTSYTYDDADRVTSVTDAALNVTHYAYDLENNLLNITDAAGHTTSFVYDAFGRVTQTAFPSSFTENYAYDAIGNVTSKTDRKNQTILYVYDALNRLSHKGYPDATGVDYAYDLAGKIKQATDPTGSYGFAYDNMDRMIGTTTQYSFLPGNTHINSYSYDAASDRTGFTAPDGSTNTYSYDTLGRLSTLTNSLTGQFSYSYDNLSHRISLNRPNGVNTSYNYDSISRLLNVLHKSGATTLDGAAYTYDNAGNRIAKTNFLNSVMEHYTYDPIYQLTQVTQGTATMESYSYDAIGNRLSSLDMSSCVYNSSNELTSTPSTTFTYDNDGNTRTKTDVSGTTTYSWDFENRLSSVALPGTGGTVTFEYDPFERRIQKSSASRTTDYMYDGADSIEETDATGALQTQYTQGEGVDQPMAEIRGGAAGSAYYQQDALSSVTSISGTTGTLLNSDIYDAFGNITASTGSFANPFQYTARDNDSETGLRYYRARYFDSVTGRFLSEDPIEFAGGTNFYRYVENSPLNYLDPFGLQSSSGQKYGPQVKVPFDRYPPFLPNGGFYYYGNWGGPGWTGGQLLPYEDLTSDQQSKLAPPIDAQDACYQQHDLCYSRGRVRNKCTSRDKPGREQRKQEGNDEGSCDFDLSVCLSSINSSHSKNFHSRIAQPLFSIFELF